MNTPPRRFTSDEECLAYLKSLNPNYDYEPEGFDYPTAHRDADALLQRFREEFGSLVTREDCGGFQDATCHARFRISPHFHITLSNFARLAAVGQDEANPDSRLLSIIVILEESGYVYVPFRIISAEDADRPAETTVTFAGQLFDFV